MDVIAPRTILRAARAFGGAIVGGAFGGVVGAVIIVSAWWQPQRFEAQRAILMASAGVGALVGWRLGPRYFRWGQFLIELLSP